MWSSFLAAVIVTQPVAPPQHLSEADIVKRPVADPLLPGLQRCPDGSILRTIDRCAEMPDHRFEFTHEPHRQDRARRWWCRGFAGKNQVSMTMEYGQAAGLADRPRQLNRLDVLIIGGRPASNSVKRSVQRLIDAFDRFDAFAGRCLFVRSGGSVPVLTLHGVAMKDGKLEWKHEEIELRHNMIRLNVKR